MIVLKKLNFQIFPSEITCLADSMHVDLTAMGALEMHTEF